MTPPQANDGTDGNDSVAQPGLVEESDPAPKDNQTVSSEFMTTENSESHTESETEQSDDVKATVSESISEGSDVPQEDLSSAPTSEEEETVSKNENQLELELEQEENVNAEDSDQENSTDLKDVENDEEDNAVVDDGVSLPMVQAEIVSSTEDSSNGEVTAVVQARMVDEEEIRLRAVENLASATAEEVKDESSNLKKNRLRGAWTLVACIVVGLMIALLVTLRDDDSGGDGSTANQQSGLAQDLTSNPSPSPSSAPTNTPSNSPTFLSFELAEGGRLNGRLTDARLDFADVRNGGNFGKDLDVVNIADNSYLLASQTAKTSMLAIMYGDTQTYLFNRRLRARRDAGIRALFTFVAFFFCDEMGCEDGAFVRGDYQDFQPQDAMALSGDGSKIALAKEGSLKLYDLEAFGVNLTKQEGIRFDPDNLDAPLGRIKGLAMNHDGSALVSLGNDLFIYNTEEVVDGFCEPRNPTPPVIINPPPLSPPSLPGNGCRRRHRKLFIPPPLPGGDDDDDNDCSDSPTTPDPCVRHLRELFIPPPLPPSGDPCTRFRRELTVNTRKLSTNLVPCTYYPLRFSWPFSLELFEETVGMGMGGNSVVVGSNKLSPSGVADGFKLRVMDLDG